MVNLHWCSLLIGLCWLIVLVTIVQVGFNIYNNTEHRNKVMAITTAVSVVWTIFSLIINGLIYRFLPKIVGLIDIFFNYVMKFLPYKFIFLWFGLVTIIAYGFFLGTGIYQYMQKKKNYRTWQKHQMEGSKKREEQLSSKQEEKLNEMLTDKDIKSTLLFRKLIKTAERHSNQIAGIKVNDGYWIPIVNQEQFTKIKKIIVPLADNIDVNELDYPMVALIGKTKVDIKTVTEAQNEFKKYLESEMEAKNKCGIS